MENGSKRNYDYEFFNYLKIKGLKCIDNRSKGGCLWICAGEDYYHDTKTIKRKFGVELRFKQSVKCLNGKSGWWMKQQILKNDTQIDFVNETESDNTSIGIDEDTLQENDNKTSDAVKNTIRGGADLPMQRIKWDIEEMVALVDVYYRCKNDKNLSVNDELNRLSKQLNYRADKLEIPHDEKYRNLNGMNLMYQNLCYIDSKGESGMSSCSKLMADTFTMYSLDPNRFNEILSSFKNNYDKDCMLSEKNDSNYVSKTECLGESNSSNETQEEYIGESDLRNETQEECIGESNSSNEIQEEYTGESNLSNETQEEFIGKNNSSNELNEESIVEKHIFDIVYDELFLILFLYRISLVDDTCDLLFEKNKVLDIMELISKHYDTKYSLSATDVDSIMNAISEYYTTRKLPDVFENEIKDFVKIFLIRAEVINIDTFKNRAYAIIDKYSYDSFADDNYFQAYQLEKLNCLLVEVSSFGFSTRTCNALTRGGINYIFDLLCATPQKLYKLDSFGKTCMNEIENTMLHFKEDLHEENQRKQAEIYRKECKELLFAGDFSQIDEKENSWVLKYKEAYDLLDSALIKECKDNPKYVCEIVKAFIEFQKEYHFNDLRKVEVEKLISQLTESKKNNRFVYYAQAYNSNKLEDIKRFYNDYNDNLSTISDSFNYADNTDYDLLSAFLKWCSFDIKKEVLNFIEAEINSRSIEVISWRIDGNSLESIGEKIGVTRERVRQIETKVQDKFDRAMRGHRYFQKLYAELNGKSNILLQDINKLFDDKGKYVWYFLKNSKCDYYKYDKTNDCILTESDGAFKEIYRFVTDLPFYVSDVEAVTLFSCRFDDSLIEDFRSLLLKYYEFYNGYYFKKKINNPELFDALIKVFFPAGIKIYDSIELDEFRTVFFNIYKYPFQENSNDRNLAVKLSRYLISIDKGVYSYRDSVTISEELLETIENYIDEDFSEVFMTQTIYNKFETELKRCSVNNRYCLQAILKEKFLNKYYFFRDYISKSKDVTGIEQQVVGYIINASEPVSKDELIREFPGITDIMLSQFLSEKSIINLFGSYISADNIIFTDEEELYLDWVLLNITSDLKQHNSREVYDYMIRASKG